jgi:dTDP-4-amino-4,6-dideoxygalactose transaminase
MTTPASPASLGRPAIDGGEPIRRDPMPPRIQVDERELEALDKVFRRRMTDGGAFDRYDGPEVDDYERELAAYFGVNWVTCVSAGTAAIHSAIGALDLEPGSEVIVSSFTDPGSVMPLLFNGLVPVFAEHDYDTFLMSPAGVRAAITPYTKAIIVAQIHGYVADMEAIGAIAREHGLTVIGDTSQAHGSTVNGSRKAPFGDIGAMSLMSGKHMVAGGQGGMVATDDEAIYWAAKRFADRGKPFGQTATSNTGLGLNYRMHELEAAMGRVQLDKLASIAERRRAVLAGIHEGIAGLSAVRPVRALPGVEINPWSAMFYVDVDQLTVTNTQFAAALEAEGIPASAGYRNAIVYGLEFWRNRKTFGTSGWPFGFELLGRRVEWRDYHHPIVERIAQTLVLLELHESWTEREAADAGAAFRKLEAAYAR